MAGCSRDQTELRCCMHSLVRHGPALEALRHLSEGVSRTKYSHVLSNDCSVPLAHRLGFSLWRSSFSGALWLLQRMPSVQSLALLLIGVAIGASGWYGIHVYAPWILAFMGKDSTLTERTVIWAASWQAVLQHPIFGYGFAAFWRGLYGPSQSVVLFAGWGLAQAQDGFLYVGSVPASSALLSSGC